MLTYAGAMRPPWWQQRGQLKRKLRPLLPQLLAPLMPLRPHFLLLLRHKPLPPRYYIHYVSAYASAYSSCASPHTPVHMCPDAAVYLAGSYCYIFFSFFSPQAAAACEAAANAAACAAPAAWEATTVRLVDARCSVYLLYWYKSTNTECGRVGSDDCAARGCEVLSLLALSLYWYKSTNTDAKGGELLGSFLRLRTRASSRCGRSPCPTPHGFRSKSALAYVAWIRSIILVQLRSSTTAVAWPTLSHGAQFTCFTGTKVQKLRSHAVLSHAVFGFRAGQRLTNMRP
jgi:hypothetical protein